MISAVPFAVPLAFASRHTDPPSVRSDPSELNDQFWPEPELHVLICTLEPLPVPETSRHLPPGVTSEPEPEPCVVLCDVVVVVVGGRTVVVVGVPPPLPE